MDLIPKRTSLVAQTASILRECIQSGLWQELLPGEHELCKRFQVSRVTLRAALLLLAREGWFKGQKGKRRAIVRDRVLKSVPTPSNVVVLLSPLHLEALPSATFFWVDALRDDLAAADYRLEFHVTPACSSRHPEHALAALRQRFRPAGWVLYLSSAAAQEWFSQRGLPCVISGSRHPLVELSSVDVDYAATCGDAARQLAVRGRRRLALLMPHSTHAGDLESEQGFRAAGEKLQAQGVQAVIAHHDGSVPAICRRLDALLHGPEPVTGLLVAKPAHVLTAVSHLLRRGLRLPGDLSLISRDDDPMLDHQVPLVARYHINPALFARKISRLVLELARSGACHPHDSRLIPELVRGETLG
jgi:DNA-binding LacI/PurR family transcriptional regulator